MAGPLQDPDRAAASVKLGAAFVDGTPDERFSVFEQWPFGVEWAYPTLSRLACVRGEKYPPGDRIIASLVLDALEGVLETRENLVALSATYRSCELASVSPAELFGLVADALPFELGQSLRDFLLRRPEERALAEFLLVERANEDGEIEIVLE